MSSRVVSMLLAVWLLLSGLATPAQAASPAAQVPSAEWLMAGSLAADHMPDTPSTPVVPEAPAERDALVDLPELFDVLRALPRDISAANGLPCPALASPAAPYLEGLRRPPRSSPRLG